jgi:hypothetical protein
MLEQFIPRDRPKSWVLMVSTDLLGLLVFAPFALLVDRWLHWIGLAGCIVCWGISAAMWFVYRVGSGSGRYVSLQPRPWKEQVW